MKKSLPLICLITICHAFSGNWSVYSDIPFGRCGIFHDDYVWFGTKGGIVRLNPHDLAYNSYTHAEGLGGLNVISLAADAEGFLWYAATNGYVGVYKDNEWHSNGTLESAYYTINRMVSHDENLWICTTKGIVRATPNANSFTLIQFDDFFEYFADLPPQPDVRDVAFLRDTIFIATERCVAFAPLASSLYPFENWDTAGVPSSDSITQRGIARITVHRDTIWVLCDYDAGGPSLHCFYDNAFHPRAPAYRDDRAWDFISLDDTLFVLSLSGLLYYRPISNGMAAIAVAAPQAGTYALVDAGDTRFAATRFGSGKIENDTLKNRIYNSPQGGDIIDISFTNNEIAVLAARGQGVNLWDGMNWMHFSYWLIQNKVDSTLRPACANIFGGIWSATQTNDGTVWVGSYGFGILRISPDTSVSIWECTNSSLATSDPDGELTVASRLRVDPLGNLWVGCYSSTDLAPLKVWQPDSQNNPYGAVSFGTSRGVPSEKLMDFDCAWDRVSIATENGAALIIHNGTIDDSADDICYNLTGQLPSNVVYATTIARDGKVWFGTEAGLAYFDPSLGYVVEVALPLDLSLGVMSLAADSFGNIWIGTFDGAAMYMPDGYFSTFKSAFSDDAAPQDRTPLLSDALGTITNTPLGGIFTDGKSGDIWFAFGGCAVVLHSPYHAQSGTQPLRIFPNPAVAERGIAPMVYIADAPPDAPLLIYNAAGELVREIDYYWKAHDGVFEWDCKNRSGELAAPGVYIVVAPSESGTAKGKLLLVQ